MKKLRKIEKLLIWVGLVVLTAAAVVFNDTTLALGALIEACTLAIIKTIETYCGNNHADTRAANIQSR